MQKFCAAQLGLGIQFTFADLAHTTSGIGGNVIGFQMGIDNKHDYQSFVWSFNFSINFPLSEPTFTRSIDNIDFPEVELRSTNDFVKYGLGLSYYPIQGWESAIVNPFAHIYTGFVLTGFEITHNKHPFNELRLSYNDMTTGNRMVAYIARAGIGLDFSISNLRKKGEDSDFSIRLAGNYNYISRMNFIDINNMNGDNPVLGFVRDNQNQTTHVVQIGNLHRVAPKYWTFEIGFIWRIFDYVSYPATQPKHNELEY